MIARPPLAVLFDLDDTILNDSGNVNECWEGACRLCTSPVADTGALLAARGAVTELRQLMEALAST